VDLVVRIRAGGWHEAHGSPARGAQFLAFRRRVQRRERRLRSEFRQPGAQRIEDRVGEAIDGERYVIFQGIVSPARSGTSRPVPKGSDSGTFHSPRSSVMRSAFTGSR
jgi:hypothetical protein